MKLTESQKILKYLREETAYKYDRDRQEDKLYNHKGRVNYGARKTPYHILFGKNTYSNTSGGEYALELNNGFSKHGQSGTEGLLTFDVEDNIIIPKTVYAKKKETEDYLKALVKMSFTDFVKELGLSEDDYKDISSFKESTVYKYDRDRGYGYFTSDGKEDPTPEKKEVIRNDFSNDEDLLFSMKRGDSIDLDYGYKITLYDDCYQIGSSHPYDDTEYSFAQSTNGTTWVVVDPSTKEKTNIEIDLNNPGEDLVKVIDKMKEIDSTKKPRIDKN